MYYDISIMVTYNLYCFIRNSKCISLSCWFCFCIHKKWFLGFHFSIEIQQRINVNNKCFIAILLWKMTRKIHIRHSQGTMIARFLPQMCKAPLLLLLRHTLKAWATDLLGFESKFKKLIKAGLWVIKIKPKLDEENFWLMQKN